MKITDRIKIVRQALTMKATNTMGTSLARSFLKFGNKTMRQDWAQTEMADADMYTGYVYGAVNNRANRVSQLASYNLKTGANDKTMEAVRKKDEIITHPYLELLDKSPSFTNNAFWYAVSTYLDLRGIYYLMAIRNFGAFKDEMRTGTVQEFKLLNPYFITEARDKNTQALLGYKEYRNGMVRDIPKEMIIPIKRLNPFDDNMLFGTVDAAKDYQFTLKQAGDHVRSSIQHNVNAPGIITTVEEYEGEELVNFKKRVMGHEKGEPIFGGGKGSIEWNPMQIDLDKAALPDVNEINRDALIAVTGASKTTLGIEQSGVTRDSAKVQRDLFTENHVMPQLQLIIDALNQDYKLNYKKDYEQNGYYLYIDNPLATDRDAEAKDVQIRGKAYNVYVTLINGGYDTETAAKFANGKIGLTELGQPKEAPATALPSVGDTGVPGGAATASVESLSDIKGAPVVKKNKAKVKKAEVTNAHDHAHEHENDMPIITNKLDEVTQQNISQSQSGLQNAIKNVDHQIIATVLSHIGKAKNAYDSTSDIISPTERARIEKELLLALSTFYTIIMPLYGSSIIKKREAELGMTAVFKLNTEVKTYITQTATTATEMHVDNLLNDILKYAQDEALAGVSQDQLVRDLQTKFMAEVDKVRAVRIARTETNRAFSMSQWQADTQFVKQNHLEGRAYKKWTTRSAEPCPICISLASEPPIPLHKPFAKLGDELSVTYEHEGKTRVLKQIVGFEDLQAGNAHPNCFCIYTLIIE